MRRGQNAYEDRLGEDLAHHARQHIAQHRRWPGPGRSQLEAERAAEAIGRAQRRPAPPGGDRRTPRSPRPRVGPFVQMRDLVGPIRLAPARAILLQPAPRIRLERLGERDRGQVQDQHRARPAPASPARISPITSRLSRPSPRGQHAAPPQQGARGQFLALQAILSRALMSAHPHRSCHHIHKGGAGRERRTGPARSEPARPTRAAVASGHLGRDHELTGQLGLAGLGEHEADHVGGPIVAEVRAVDRDGWPRRPPGRSRWPLGSLLRHAGR